MAREETRRGVGREQGTPLATDVTDGDGYRTVALETLLLRVLQLLFPSLFAKQFFVPPKHVGARL